jgi:hypothetical protein
LSIKLTPELREEGGGRKNSKQIPITKGLKAFGFDIRAYLGFSV